MNYYISDTHFGHYNILKHSKRPFTSVEEMDETIIENWNDVVTDNDDVYILGDFCFKSENPEIYLKRLKGKLHLIIGNHDGVILKNRRLKEYFVEIKDILTITDKGKRIVLCHYPLCEWPGYFRDTLHFYGHIHNNEENMSFKIMATIPNAYNVGVDIIGFAPQTVDQIIKGR